MNSKKRRERKQIITLAIVAAVILALVVVYFIIADMTSGGGEDTEPTLSDIGDIGSFTIVEEDYTKITGLEYTRGEETVKLKVSEGIWTVADDPEYPLDQATVILMAEAISDFGGNSRHVYDEAKASSYGTDSPTLSVSATYYTSDGKDTYTRSFIVGDKNRISGNYYFYEPGEKYIYTVTGEILDYFNYTVKTLLTPTEMPDPDGDDILALSVTTPDGSYNYDAKTDTDVDVDDADSPVAQVMDALPKSALFDYDHLAAYGITGEGLAEYGLAAPSAKVELKYNEYTSVPSADGGSTGQIARELELIVSFGSKFTEGEGEDAVEYVYVTVGDSGMIFKTIAETLDDILAVVGK